MQARLHGMVLPYQTKRRTQQEVGVIIIVRIMVQVNPARTMQYIIHKEHFLWELQEASIASL